MKKISLIFLSLPFMVIGLALNIYSSFNEKIFGEILIGKVYADVPISNEVIGSVTTTEGQGQGQGEGEGEGQGQGCQGEGQGTGMSCS